MPTTLYIFVLESAQLAEQHYLSFGIGPKFQQSPLHSENTKCFITNKGTSGQRNTHAIRLLDESSLGQAFQNIRKAKKSKSEKSQTEKLIANEKIRKRKVKNQKIANRKIKNRKITNRKVKNRKIANRKIKNQKIKNRKIKNQKMMEL